MRKISTLIITLAIAQCAFAQEAKYKISAAEMMEYERLAEAVTVNVDTSVTISKENRQKVYRVKLNTFVKSHKLVVQEKELREQIRALNKTKKGIETVGNKEIASLITSREEKKLLKEVWKREKKYLRKQDQLKRQKEREERLKKISPGGKGE